MGNDKINLQYWVWLQTVLGYQSTKFLGIINKYKTAENVYKCDRVLLKSSGLFTAKQLGNIESTDLSAALDVINQCYNNNIKIITFEDAYYPQKLRNIASPPIVIYVLGKMPDFNLVPSVCVVGPRKPSEYGVKAAFSLSYRIAKGEIVVVSGGALGIDTCAHSGAIAASGKTVAVLGCGLLDKYLAQNKQLRQTICENGCLISEFQPNFSATKFSFPMRNRIMSGLCDGTVVIEAKLKSGSLITANCAVEQGRDVFVIPGNPGNPNCEGSNLLFKDGAIPLFNADDIFNEYCHIYPNIIDADKAFGEDVDRHLASSYKIFAGSFMKRTEIVKPIKNKSASNCNEALPKQEQILNNPPDLSKLSELENTVLAALPNGAFVPEQLNLSQVNYSDIYLALTKLEIAGIIESVPGGMYRKII